MRRKVSSRGRWWLLPAAVVLPTVLVACAPPPGAVETRAALEQGDYAAAEREVERSLRAHPRDRDLLELKIRLQLVRGHPERAVALYRARAGGDDDLLQRFALATIWAAMRNRDPAVRLRAVQVARRTDAPPLAPEMVRRLDDPAPLVRTYAAAALSHRARGADVLEQQLRVDDPAARAAAVTEVSKIAGEAALDVVRRASKDGAQRVRVAAARGLGAVGTPAALAVLRRLAVDPSTAVRYAAARSLGKFEASQARAALQRLAEDDEHTVRRAALGALARKHPEAAAVVLRRIARGDELGEALDAGRLLARAGQPQPVLDAIAKALVDKRWTLRAAAVNTASSVDDRVALRLVRPALRDPQPAVRMAAARALATHHAGRAKALRVAASLLQLGCRTKKDERPALADLCLQSAELLGRYGDRRGMRRLHQLARSAPSWQRRARALEIALRQRHAGRLALAALGDEEPRVALVAALHLYRELD